jgi:hypothetical protein
VGVILLVKGVGAGKPNQLREFRERVQPGKRGWRESGAISMRRRNNHSLIFVLNFGGEIQISHFIKWGKLPVMIVLDLAWKLTFRTLVRHSFVFAGLSNNWSIPLGPGTVAVNG